MERQDSSSVLDFLYLIDTSTLPSSTHLGRTLLFVLPLLPTLWYPLRRNKCNPDSSSISVDFSVPPNRQLSKRPRQPLTRPVTWIRNQNICLLVVCRSSSSCLHVLPVLCEDNLCKLSLPEAPEVNYCKTVSVKTLEAPEDNYCKTYLLLM